MQTEFTCGIYTVKANAFKWRLEINNNTIAIIEADGHLMHLFQGAIILTCDDLIEIAVLMNNIKRQYKQSQNT